MLLSDQAFAFTPDHIFRSKDIAALFVSVTQHWYDDPQNALFRKKAEVYNLIRVYLETGIIPESPPYYLAYALAKFRAEWIDLDDPEKSEKMVVKVNG